MSSPYLGEIRLLSFAFPPQGWLACSGQLLPINQYQALFSLLGTSYGGNGVSTFALPNLQGQVAVGYGNGAGLTPRTLGQAFGVASETVAASQLPAHGHTLYGNSSRGNVDSPANASLAAAHDGNLGLDVSLFSSQAPTTAMDASSVGPAGGGQPVSVLQPYLVLQYAIAIAGIYPSRT